MGGLAERNPPNVFVSLPEHPAEYGPCPKPPYAVLIRSRPDRAGSRLTQRPRRSLSEIAGGMGSSCARRLSRYPSIASRMFVKASSRDDPCEMHPGSAGTWTTNAPSSSCSISTLYFMVGDPLHARWSVTRDARSTGCHEGPQWRGPICLVGDKGRSRGGGAFAASSLPTAACAWAGNRA